MIVIDDNGNVIGVDEFYYNLKFSKKPGISV